MIELLWPIAFLLLPLPVFMRLWKKAGTMTPMDNAEPALQVPFFDQLRAYTPAIQKKAATSVPIFLTLAWILAVLALTRPVWVDNRPMPLAQSGRNVLLAIDTSGSMAQTDLSLNNQPTTRFALVHGIVKDFIQKRAGDNLGLILFGSEAYTFVPLSLDTKTTAALFDEAGIGIAGEMTAIGDAIALGVKNLADTPTNKRVLILLSDGYNNAGKLPLNKAIELAQQENVKIYTIGVGAEKQLIQTFFGLQAINPSADLDEETLRQIADETGGRYFRARSTDELADIYQTLNQLEPLPQSNTAAHAQKELFFIPLALALFFFFFVFYERRWA